MSYEFFLKIFFVILSYFICGIPFGYLIFKLIKHDDIRKYGSGNIGATNVGRLIGKKYAIITFLLDGFKGFICVFLSKLIFKDLNYNDTYFYINLLICILGHIYSPYLKFKGGKAIAIFITTLYVVNIKLAICMSICWILCFKVTKISALSALFATLCTTIFSFFILNIENFFIIFIISLIIFYAHRANISRLLKGEELGFKKKL